MDPEQGLFVVVEDIAVELFVFLLGTVVRVLGPQRSGVVQSYRTLYDL